MPKVSIITACHNDATYLEQCCRSVEQQTYRDFEHIVVITGTARPTFESNISATFIIPDPGGLSSTRNFGLQKAQGEYIVALDADDYLHPRFLEKVSAKANPSVIVCPGMQEVGERANAGWPTWGTSYIEFVANNRIFVCSMYSREDALAVGGYDPKLDQLGSEDWCLWCDLLKAGCTVVVVPELLFYYRVHSRSLMMTMGVRDDAVAYLRGKHK